jgi:hypothetical protein
LWRSTSGSALTAVVVIAAAGIVVVPALWRFGGGVRPPGYRQGWTKG